MTALLDYLNLMLSDIGQAKTHLQKVFPETLENFLVHSVFVATKMT